MELRDLGAEKEWSFCVELRGCGTKGDSIFIKIHQYGRKPTVQFLSTSSNKSCVIVNEMKFYESVNPSIMSL